MNVGDLLRAGLCDQGRERREQAGNRVPGYRMPDKRIARHPAFRRQLLLRRQRVIHPAVKLLLVGFYPAVNMTLNVSFRRFALMHHRVLRVNVRQRQFHDGKQFRRRRVFLCPGDRKSVV